jgi:hypothetical protein
MSMKNYQSIGLDAINGKPNDQAALDLDAIKNISGQSEALSSASPTHHL